MKTSKYAPRTPAETLAQSREQKLKQEKEQETRLLGRLRWKAELLMTSYHKALSIVQAVDAQQNGHSGLDSKQAESMFKIDFFEFYTLLERYITACLAILGISVSGSAPQTNVNALRYITNPDLHRTRPMASHAFHANLLEALDDEKCPLYASFGIQYVRVELAVAKDFRNAWKDADERMIASKWDDENDRSRKNITLTDSQLEQMLRAIVAGSEHAHGVVQGHTNTQTNGSRDFEPQAHSSSSNNYSDDTPFEYMDDAMDLD
ncbi:hypothetical protein CC86DRAFT_385203 [Ophiobolus disseminans]|uniref:Uncharacterized protein n=1 Tax=Ophiobolus disseminans TaxID=1469910 RepID=A0A6A6ZRZ4_9PLEO|nr:hypothetical protein CC86DRAFT_385203 [Ophiobolus disseminans]